MVSDAFALPVCRQTPCLINNRFVVLGTDVGSRHAFVLWDESDIKRAFPFTYAVFGCST